MRRIWGSLWASVVSVGIVLLTGRVPEAADFSYASRSTAVCQSPAAARIGGDDHLPNRDPSITSSPLAVVEQSPPPMDWRGFDDGIPMLPPRRNPFWFGPSQAYRVMMAASASECLVPPALTGLREQARVQRVARARGSRGSVPASPRMMKRGLATVWLQ